VELDHLFIVTTPDAPEGRRLEALGLTPTYRRAHVGQGTANVCYCFENAFLEVLWITSEAEARSASVARMQLSQRAQWRTSKTNPFGIAWRGATTGAHPIPTWSCTPPYLPAGVAIDVATESDDLTQPLMFSFPGARPPREWPDARRGTLQTAGGFTRLALSKLWLPAAGKPSDTLRRIAAFSDASIGVGETDAYGLDITLVRHGSEPGLQLRLPACEVRR
jgi:Glyoxalase-like domain